MTSWRKRDAVVSPRGQARAIAGAVDGERISIRGVRIYAEAARIGRLVIGGTATGP